MHSIERERELLGKMLLNNKFFAYHTYRVLIQSLRILCVCGVRAPCTSVPEHFLYTIDFIFHTLHSKSKSKIEIMDREKQTEKRRTP